MFCYRCEEFRNDLIKNFDKIPLNVYVDIFEDLLVEERKVATNDNDEYLRVMRLKCLLAFQMAFLYNIIDSVQISKEDANLYNRIELQDPRAIGIKVLVDIIQYSKNSFIRTIAIDCICRLIKTDKTLVEPIIIVDSVEILCKQLEIASGNVIKISEKEIGNCAITLAHLVDFSAEGRRRIIKISRRVPMIMQSLKYYNQSLNLDLRLQWEHYENIFNMCKNKQVYPKTSVFLPQINQKKK